ncbi:hypothetical protein [Thiothrix subterranea]|nr:hypothetical protein [Thiothrix subterranea]
MKKALLATLFDFLPMLASTNGKGVKQDFAKAELWYKKFTA